MLKKEEEANPSGFKVVSDKVDPPNIEKLNTSGFKVVSDKAGPALVDDLGLSVANELLADEMKEELFCCPKRYCACVCNDTALVETYQSRCRGLT